MLTRTIDGSKFLVPETIEMVIVKCYKCLIPFAMPQELKDYFKKKGQEASFWCPNGHEQCYTKSDADRVREEAEKEHQRLRDIVDRKNLEINSLTDKMLDEMNKKIKLEKQLKRVHKGVCPCCNRSFMNLHKHMQTKHPEIANNK